MKLGWLKVRERCRVYGDAQGWPARSANQIGISNLSMNLACEFDRVSIHLD